MSFKERQFKCPVCNTLLLSRSYEKVWRACDDDQWESVRDYINKLESMIAKLHKDINELKR